MLKYSKKSLRALRQAHVDLQRVSSLLLARGFDHSVSSATRGRLSQERLFRQGTTKARYGQSAHNFSPSRAIHLLPYPFAGWDYMPQFYFLAGAVEAVAIELDVDLVWGGDWDEDMDFKDNRFNDLVHWELKDWRDL